MKRWRCNEIGRLVCLQGTVIVIAWFAFAVGAAAQTIDSIGDTSLPRSGRLLVYGSGFGIEDANSRVTVGDIDAPIAFWDDTAIHAYVPESTPIGMADVRVVTTGGTSNGVSLDVTSRPASEGRIRWRFTMDEDLVLTRPAVGPDGTVYVTGMYGHLYALSPDGGLLWIRRSVNGIRSPVVGADGTIYVGGGPGLRALNPDGSDKWSVALSGTMFMGPALGPDDNIYGATELSGSGNGTGAFIVSPVGSLRFSDDPGLSIRSIPYPWQIGFTDSQWFVTSGMGGPVEGVFGVFAYELGQVSGSFSWQRTGLTSTHGLESGAAAGALTLNDPFSNRIASYDANGSVRWSVSLNELGGSPGEAAQDPVIGTYFVPVLTPPHLHAIDVAGDLLWTVSPDRQYLYPVVSPDASQLVVAAGSPEFTQPASVRALDPADGSTLWDVPLDIAFGRRFTVRGYASFSNDGTTVYAAGSGSPVPEPYSTLYAIDAEPTPEVEIAIESTQTEVRASESLDLTLTVRSHVAQPRTVDGWLEAFKPNGSPWSGNPLAGPKKFTLPAGGTIQKSFSIRIPGGTPPSGPYRIDAVIGTFPDGEDRAGVTFTVVP